MQREQKKKRLEECKNFLLHLAELGGEKKKVEHGLAATKTEERGESEEFASLFSHVTVNRAGVCVCVVSSVFWCVCVLI